MDAREEQVMDAAISDALGMTGEAPADFQGSAAADETTRRSERALRETVARLSAASPFLKPSSELRARILQASAPRTFKLEDYRKVGAEDFRWYKWGFYAAAVFLILGAMYNMNVSGNLQQAAQKNSQLVAALNRAMAGGKQRDDALAALVDPHGMQITWNDPTTNKPFGRAVINSAGNAVMIFPAELLPPGSNPQLTLKSEDGRVRTFQTVLITAPAQELALTLPANMPQVKAGLARMLKAPQQLAPGGEPGTPRTANMQLPVP